MNRAGVFFEGWSSRHLYNTKLIPETPKLSLELKKKKKKYHDEKQTYLGEKMLRKWYLKVAGDMHFTWSDFSSCSFSMSSVPMCTEGLSSEERTGEGNTHTVETANLAPSFSTLLLTTCVISDKAL